MTNYTQKVIPKVTTTVLILDKLIKHGKFNNWGYRKKDDPKNLLGYYNFKSYAIIDNKKECIRLAVQVYRNGNIYFNPYYNLEVNKKERRLATQQDVKNVT